MTSENTTVTQVGLVEAGTMLGQGLQFVGMDEALAKVIEKHAGKMCILSPAVAAVEADEEKNIEAVEAVDAVSITISASVKQELLGAVAVLPQLRSIFTTQIAEAIAEGRQDNDEYDKLLSGLKGAKTRLENAEQAIYEFDEEAVPGFDIEALVNWSPDEDPTVKNFTAARNGRSGTRRRSLAKWSLDRYECKQDEVSGDGGSFHNPVLISHPQGWQVTTDEGVLEPQKSGSEAMKDLLAQAGLSGQRSAVGFWKVVEQEQAAGV